MQARDAATIIVATNTTMIMFNGLGDINDVGFTRMIQKIEFAQVSMNQFAFLVHFPDQ